MLLALAVALSAGALAAMPTDASAAKPDLVASSMSNPPAALQPAGAFAVTDKTRNKGRKRAGRSTTAYYLSLDKKRGAGDFVLKARRSVKALGSRKSSRGSKTVAVPALALGMYHVLACADAKKKVKEASERNNCRASSKRAAIMGAPGPGAGAPGNSGGGLPGGGGGSPGNPADPDGDGFLANDCAPNDPGAHPGADDRPDMAFSDRNCDGIDGDPAKAVFVSPSGNDGHDGTRAQPKRTVRAALLAAASTTPRRDVYAASGIYAIEPDPIALETDVGIYGGYSPADWSRSLSAESLLSAVGSGAVAESDTGVVLQHLRLEGLDSGPAASVYGLRARNSGLNLERVEVVARDAHDGATGTSAVSPAQPGQPGQQGQPGVEDSSGLCGSGAQPQGGNPGNLNAIVGGPSSGGRGGNAAKGTATGQVGFSAPGGATGGAGVQSGRGNWNPTAAFLGGDGADGTDGSNGGAGSPGYNLNGFGPSGGGGGTGGANAKGGGGGGGGGGGDVNCDSYGGGGGGGGAGGAGGTGGGGGASGGGSFGVFLWNSTFTATDSVIEAGDGGRGGNGGSGRLGGNGGLGGRCLGNAGNCYGGSGEQDDGSNGGRGGDGGDGGDGGTGGGGAGGPSIGVLVGNGSSASMPGSTFVLGSAGAGGSATGGNAGPAGVRAETHTAL